MRRTWDLEHWAAFQRSFDALGAVFARIGSGALGPTGDRVGAEPAYTPPASISVLSGDVHHSYVARAQFDNPGAHAGAPAHLLADPQPGAGRDAPADEAMLERRAGLGRPASRASAGVGRPTVSWKKLAGPYFRQRGRHPGTPPGGAPRS